MGYIHIDLPNKNNKWVEFELMNVDIFIIYIRFKLTNVNIIYILIQYKYD